MLGGNGVFCWIRELETVPMNVVLMRFEVRVVNGKDLGVGTDPLVLKSH